MTIPEEYRQWAKEEAEREYPDVPGLPSLQYEAEGLREAYVGAILRMWPVVEALQRLDIDPTWYQWMHQTPTKLASSHTAMPSASYQPFPL